MMKRFRNYLFIVLALLVIFGVAGCNSDPVDIDVTEFVDTPTNLEINGNVLSWDEVEGAQGYIVYVNDVEEETVRTNSFDFSSLEGDHLVFRVQAKASRGFNDSALSVSIAYVENKDAEVLAMNVVLAENSLALIADGLAEELVNKGMTADDMEASIDAINLFYEDMQDTDMDMLDVNAAIKTMMETDMNIEAMLSAILKTIVPQALQATINELDLEIMYYQDLIAGNPAQSSYYQDTLDQLQEQKAIYEDLVEMIEEESDETLLALVGVVEYIIAFQEDIDQEFLQKIYDLVNDDELDFTTLNPEEVIVIKDEYVAILRENVPSMEMMVLTFEAVNGVLQAVTGETQGSEYNTKYAAEAVLSFELYIEYVDSFDLDFVNEVKTLGSQYSDADNDLMFQAELEVLMLTYFDQFLEDNDDLVTQMEEVFTDEEKADIFNTYIESFDETIIDDEVLLAIIQGLNYDELMAVQAIFDESFEILLDAFVENDGELLRKVAVLNGFYSNLEEEYYNGALDETYANYTEYANACNDANFEMIKEVLVLFDAVIQNLEEEDVNAVIALLMSPINYETIGEVSGLTEAQVTELETNLEGFLTGQMSNLLTLVQDLSEYMDTEATIDDLISLYSDINDLYVAEYGADYKNGISYYESDYEFYYTIIFAADNFTTFMDTNNQALVDDIALEFFTLMKTPEFLTISNFTLQDVNPIETGFNDAFDFMISEFAVFADYDPANLTTVEKERISAFYENLAVEFYGDN